MIVLAAATLGALIYLVVRDDAPADDARLIDRAGGRPATSGGLPGSATDADLPAPLGGDAIARAAEPEAEPGAPADWDPDAVAALYDGRAIEGRVRTADGSPLPAPLQLVARLDRPDPRVGAFTDLVHGLDDVDATDVFSDAAERRAATRGDGGDGDDGDGGGDEPGASAVQAVLDALPDDWLQRLTRTAVRADGTFAMDGVPAAGAFLDVESDELYPDPVVFVEPGAGAVSVVLVRGAHLVGRVSDAQGEAIAGAALSAATPFDPYAMFDPGSRFARIGETHAGADGRYALHRVPPDLAFDLAASATGHAYAKAGVPPLPPGATGRVDVVLPPQCAVSGTVVDEDGAPVPSAPVHLQRASFSMADIGVDDGDQLRAEHPTDAAGRFRFDSLAAGSYQLVLGAPGYRLAKSETLELDVGEQAHGLVLLAERGLTITGRVVERTEEGAEPLAAARVRGSRPPRLGEVWGGQEREFLPWIDTDEDGRFTVGGLEEGDVQLQVLRTGFAPEKLTVAAGARDVEIALQRHASVSGIAVSLVDGEPVRDFSVKLMPSGGVFDMGNLLGIEDRIGSVKPSERFRVDDGRFTIEAVRPGRYDLTAQGPGFGEVTLAGIEVAAGRETKGVVVMLPEEAAVSGRVVSARTGAPVPGAKIAAGNQGGMFDEISKMMTGGGRHETTDAEGRFTLGGLGGEPFRLFVESSEFQQLGVAVGPLQPGERRDLGDLLLATGATVHGGVYDERDDPVPGVPVMVADTLGRTMRRATTDSRGEYRVQGLPAGTYNVMRTDFELSLDLEQTSDFLEQFQFESVTLRADEERRVDLRMRRGGVRLEGVVRTAGGGGTMAAVTLVPEAGTSAFRFTMTGADGGYEIDSVPPGRYTLSVQPMDGSNLAQQGQQAGAAHVESLQLDDAPTQRRDVTLPGGVLPVVVTSRADGARLAGVRLLLERTDAGRPELAMLRATDWRVAELYSDAAGEATFRHLSPGTYTVVAGGVNMLGLGAGEWAVARREGLSVGEGPAIGAVRLELQPSGAIEGVVAGAGGAPAPGVSLWARDESDRWVSVLSEVSTDAAGHYRYEGLGAGEWTLALRDEQHALTLVEGVTVRAGETTEQPVLLARGVRVVVDLRQVDLDAAQVSWEIDGPYGRVPSELATIGSLLAGSAQAEVLELGRLLPGRYRVTIREDGRTVFDDEVVLDPSEDVHTVLLEQH